MRKSVVYYTDFSAPPELMALCTAQLQAAAGDAEIITVGLNKSAGFGVRLIFHGERGIQAMHAQILLGLTRASGDIVYMCEHDVLYHPSHFRGDVSQDDIFYYNANVWHARYPDGHAVYYDAQQVSGLCASRALLIDFYTARLAQVKSDGHNRHYEPGLKQTVGGQKVENWYSAFPNIDVRHGANLTGSKWSPADFRNPRYAAGWRETDSLPGWGRLADVFSKGVPEQCR